MALAERYRNRYAGWNVRHFHAHYLRGGGARDYTWVKSRPQEAGLVSRAPRRGAYRKRRGAIALARHDLCIRTAAATSGSPDRSGISSSPWTTPLASITPCSSSTRKAPRAVSRASGMLSWLGVVWLPHTDRGATTGTPRGRRQGRPDPSDPVRTGDAALGITMIPAYSPEAREEASGRFAPTRTGFPRVGPPRHQYHGGSHPVSAEGL